MKKVLIIAALLIGRVAYEYSCDVCDYTLQHNTHVKTPHVRLSSVCLKILLHIIIINAIFIHFLAVKIEI